MHTPTPDPMEDEEEPPVPPDEETEVIPQREPPSPDESRPLRMSSLPSVHVGNHQDDGQHDDDGADSVGTLG